MNVNILPLRFDRQQGKVWQGEQLVSLRPLEQALLVSLMERPGQLVLFTELRAKLWPGIKSSAGVLRNHIYEVRRTLGDLAHTPRYIETVPRRGYRFIGPVVSKEEGAGSREPEGGIHFSPVLVGRDAELVSLSQYWQKAQSGERQVVFVTGEAGIGKTSLVDTFRQRLVSSGQGLKESETRDWRLETSFSSPQASSLKPPASPVHFTHGQCLQLHGSGEPYLPFLEALTQLGWSSSATSPPPDPPSTALRTGLLAGAREPENVGLRATPGSFASLLRQYAPSWLAQYPSLVPPEEYAILQGSLVHPTPERMLRELVLLLEALTTYAPLVLVIEDAQWSDSATLDAISYLARRREPARLLLIITARTGEQGPHSQHLANLQHELRAHGQGAHLHLDPLRATAIADYLTTRFPSSVFPTALPELLHRRSGGNPLFLSALIEECVTNGFLTNSENTWTFVGDLATLNNTLPATLRDLLHALASGLTAMERQLLQAASLVGAEFTTALITTAVEQNVIAVETACESLVERQQFLRRAGVVQWPDGTQTTRYGFRHALYQQFWHEQVPLSQRQQWHHRIGERLVTAYGNQAQDIAAELAEHFAEARDVARTLAYRQQAAQAAVRRGALQAGVQQLTAALDFLKTLPDTSERTQQELELVLALGALLIGVQGYASTPVKTTYARAKALLPQNQSLPTQQFPIVRGLWGYHFVRAELTAADELAAQALRIATTANEPALLVHAHESAGALAFHRGDLLRARHHLAQASASYHVPDAALTALAGQDPGIFYLSYEAFTLALLGETELAQQKCQQMLNLASAVQHWYSQVCGLVLAAWLCQLQRTRLIEAERWATTAVQRAEHYGFAQQRGQAACLRGSILVMLGQIEKGLNELHQGLAIFEATGAVLEQPHLLGLLAEAYGKNQQFAEALETVTKAITIAEQTGELYYAPELYRLKGELLYHAEYGMRNGDLKTSHHSASVPRFEAAEACFLKALAIAQQQHAKLWEVRAVASFHEWQRRKR